MSANHRFTSKLGHGHSTRQMVRAIRNPLAFGMTWVCDTVAALVTDGNGLQGDGAGNSVIRLLRNMRTGMPRRANRRQKSSMAKTFVSWRDDIPDERTVAELPINNTLVIINRHTDCQRNAIGTLAVSTCSHVLPTGEPSCRAPGEPA